MVVCRMLEPSPMAAMSDCCAGMHHSGISDAGMSKKNCGGGETTLRAASCTDGCCTAAPQNPAAATNVVKAAADPAPTVAILHAAPAPVASASEAAWSDPPGSSSIPRHVLLHTFRI
jgi:hypothetical protein